MFLIVNIEGINVGNLFTRGVRGMRDKNYKIKLYFDNKLIKIYSKSMDDLERKYNIKLS